MNTRLFLLAGLLSALFVPLRAQFVCFSDSTAIYEFQGVKLPPMVGEAVFHSGQFRVIVGGKFLDIAEPAAEAVYNCDMLVLDEKAQKTYVLPLSYFPPFVADQFAGVNYAFTTDRDTAYVLGGFGYDLVKGVETTFPTLTFFPLKTLIDSVVQGKDYLDLFSVIESDRRLAITEGTLVKIGATFLVYNGREILPVEEEFNDQPTVNEWDFRGQLRKFTLKNTDGYLEIGEFQVCNTSKVFYQCMPGKD
jgi:hypothetical protein